MSFQHVQPFLPVHKLLADVAQKQAACGAGRARLPSRGNQSKFSLISPPSHTTPQIKALLVLARGFAASGQRFIGRWSGGCDWKSQSQSLFWGGMSSILLPADANLHGPE